MVPKAIDRLASALETGDLKVAMEVIKFAGGSSLLTGVGPTDPDQIRADDARKEAMARSMGALLAEIDASFGVG